MIFLNCVEIMFVHRKNAAPTCISKIMRHKTIALKMVIVYSPPDKDFLTDSKNFVQIHKTTKTSLCPICLIHGITKTSLCPICLIHGTTKTSLCPIWLFHGTTKTSLCPICLIHGTTKHPCVLSVSYCILSSTFVF